VHEDGLDGRATMNGRAAAGDQAALSYEERNQMSNIGWPKTSGTARLLGCVNASRKVDGDLVLPRILPEADRSRRLCVKQCGTHISVLSQPSPPAPLSDISPHFFTQRFSAAVGEEPNNLVFHMRSRALARA